MNDVRRTGSFGVPWEEDHCCVQAVRHGDTVRLSGQVAHDGTELVGPAPVGEDGRVTDLSRTGPKLRQCYTNAAQLLRRFGASRVWGSATSG